MMCCGMNAINRRTPGTTLATSDCVLMAVAKPVARVAKVLMAKRTASIGNVNVIAAATLAYAGQAGRMTAPATNTTATQTPRPAPTPRIFFDILGPFTRSKQHGALLHARRMLCPIVLREV